MDYCLDMITGNISSICSLSSRNLCSRLWFVIPSELFFFVVFFLEILDIQRRWACTGSSQNRAGLKSTYLNIHALCYIAQSIDECMHLYLLVDVDHRWDSNWHFYIIFSWWFYSCASLENTVSHSQWESRYCFQQEGSCSTRQYVGIHVTRRTSAVGIKPT